MGLTMHYARPEPAAATILPPAHEPSLADEMNHRIANGLQLLAAMISAAAREITDPRAIDALSATRRRIEAIAGVHRQLYREVEAHALDLGSYVEDIAIELERSCGDCKAGRMVCTDVEHVFASPEAATSVGVILSELVGNAFKYAYPGGVPGEVRIALRALPFGGFELSVEDDGPGIEPGAAPQGTGLGSRLIGMMAQRLGADHGWRVAGPGTRFVLHAANL